MLKPTFLRLTSSPTATNRDRARRYGRGIAEALEVRSLLSATSWPGLVDPQLEREGNDRLDVAEHLGDVRHGRDAEFIGSIGGATGVSSDVDWLSFTLDANSRVQIVARADANGATTPVVLSLFGDQLVEFDPAVPNGHRAFGRRESHAGPVRFNVELNAGTYFVAVSGAGNRFFHPFMSDSGLLGVATEYGLSVTVVADSSTSSEPLGDSSSSEASRHGNDVPNTAIELGDLAAAEHVQVEGAIGDDPFYNPDSSNPFAQNPANDVDLYRFEIQGDGRFAIVAEAFAGRIGSALDPALTLFQADADGSLRVIAANNNTLNDVESANGQFPLFADSVVFAGLTAGEYFIAVSSSGNDVESGPGGVFDPNVAHSGLNGYSVGAYTLDVRVTSDNLAPRVVATTPTRGTTLNQPPTHLTVQFSEQVNAQVLAYLESQEAGDTTARPVFVLGSDGTRYVPRLQSYEPRSGVAQFLMLDALPSGTFELHVSGPEGLTDLAGLPIQANDPSGDFVTRFAVTGTTRGSDAGPTTWLNAEVNDSVETAQNLGVLFPRELQNGVTLVRDAGHSADSADHFQFELLQSRTIAFSVQNTGDAGRASLEVLNADGQIISLLSLADGTLLLGFVRAGRYTLRASGWDSADSADVAYRTTIGLLGAGENPTPLTTGATVASGIQLRNSGTSTLITPPVAITLAATPATMPVPNLLQGLQARAIGQPDVSPTSTTTDTAIVRLFGFGDRDRLFTMIDSTLRRMSESLEVTRAELTDDELRDLLQTKPPDASVPAKSPEAEAADMDNPEPATPTPAEPKRIEDSVSSEAPDNPSDSGKPVAKLRRKLPTITESVTTETAPEACSPIALAFATSLAISLRDHARRSDDQRGLKV